MNNAPEKNLEKETGRLEAFSDGVFGVAVTLLAIEIAVKENPLQTNEGLWKEIINNWPRYFGYFNSFATVLLMWMSHHEIFKRVKKTSMRLVLANGLLLLLIALVPYPTRTLSEFLETPARQAAILFYVGYFIFISIGFNLLCRAALQEKNVLNDASLRKPLTQIARHQFAGLLLNMIVTVVALFYPLIALVMNFVLWIFFAAIMKTEMQE